MTIINADLGESVGLHSFGNDDDLMSLIDWANVACGYHAGDPAAMRSTIAKAVAADVKIGAHPGLPDIPGFGRREMKLTPADVRDIVLYQVGALVGFIEDAGATLNHIKPHGSLYSMVSRDQDLMAAVCDVAEQWAVPVLGLPGTAHQEVADRRGVPFVAELYVDVPYAEDGRVEVMPRQVPTEPAVAASRALRAFEDGVIETTGGSVLPIVFEAICIHSDNPHAVAVARAVRRVVDERPTRAATASKRG